MPLGIEKAKIVATNTIMKSLRHINYARTVEIAKLSKQMMTGNGQDELLVSVKNRESATMKKQRIRLTNSYTPYVLNQIKSIVRRLRRTDGILELIEHENEERVGELKRKLATYHGRVNFSQHIFNKLLHYNFHDPNAYLIFEYNDEFRGNEVNSYIVEAKAHEVINLSYEFGNLDWIMIEQVQDNSEDITQELSDDAPMITTTVQLKKYLFYGQGYNLIYTEFDKKLGPNNNDGGEEIKIGNRYFTLTEHSSTDDIQAVRAGALLDAETDEQTCVPFFYPAINILKDLIRDKSYLDITKALHTFLQKYAYVNKCNFESDESGYCDEGFLNGDKSMPCPNCDGQGHLLHSSEQDVIAINYPDGGETPIPLSTFVHYVQLPHETPRFQKEEVEASLKRVVTAIFNSEIFQTPQLANTATASIIEHEKIYDVLTDFANTHSVVWITGVELTAQMIDFDDVLVGHSYPTDYKMKSLNELFADYERAKSAGMGSKVLDGIMLDIIDKLYRNSPKAGQTIKIFSKYKPFKDLSPELLSAVVSARATDDYDRVLFENFDRVCKEVLAQYPDFIEMTEEVRTNLIKVKVAELITVIKYSSIGSVVKLPFANPINDDE